MLPLKRHEFRTSVFQRDNGECVNCKKPATDAHHIIDRSLFPDGGYYIDNGVSLCPDCHILSEKTLLSCNELRDKAKIQRIILPEHLYTDTEYDKWGNPILQSGERLKGELFFESSVQKVLSDVLYLFSDYIKYPRTYHLPWSESVGRDDRVLSSTKQFENEKVIVSVKLDGENFSVYHDGYFHARSLNSNDHESRHWVKNFASKVCFELPKYWRIVGENLYAKHTIHYKNLDTYFYLISIWDAYNNCLDWEETVTWANLLDIQTVPVIYNDIWNEEAITGLYQPTLSNDPMEGYVVRLKAGFAYKEFKDKTGKFVSRKFKEDLKETHGHWIKKQVIKNELK